jgi:uncharacterized membrane protein
MSNRYVLTVLVCTVSGLVLVTLLLLLASGYGWIEALSGCAIVAIVVIVLAEATMHAIDDGSDG